MDALRNGADRSSVLKLLGFKSSQLLARHKSFFQSDSSASKLLRNTPVTQWQYVPQYIAVPTHSPISRAQFSSPLFLSRQYISRTHHVMSFAYIRIHVHEHTSRNRYETQQELHACTHRKHKRVMLGLIGDNATVTIIT